MDWMALPPELLRLISKKLLSIFDFVRFRAVCQQWRRSALTSDAAPQLPWLVEDHRLSELGEVIDCRGYCISSGTTHTIRIDKCDKSERFLHLLCTGYLLAVGGEGSLCLINVFTNKEIPLPTLDVDMIDPIPVSHNQGKDLVVIETFLDCESSVVCFCRLNEKAWRKTNLRRTRVNSSYYNGSCLFLQDSFDDVTIVDAVTGSILFEVPLCVPVGHFCYDNYHQCLMNAVHESFGKILAISVIFDDSKNIVGFEISQLVQQDDLSEPQLVKMSNIGDIALFFDYDNVFSARAQEFPGLIKGNSVYFPYDYWVEDHIPGRDGNWISKQTMNTVLGRYDLEKKTVETIGPSLEGSYSWMVPNLC